MTSPLAASRTLLRYAALTAVRRRDDRAVPVDGGHVADRTDADIGQRCDAEPHSRTRSPATTTYRVLATPSRSGASPRNSVRVAVASTLLQVFTSVDRRLRASPAAVPRRAASSSSLYVATMMIPSAGDHRAAVHRDAEPRTWSTPTPACCCRPSCRASGVFMLRQAFLALPKELDEAAFIDGAGHFRVFARMLLPLVGPGAGHVRRVRLHVQLERVPLAARHRPDRGTHDAPGRAVAAATGATARPGTWSWPGRSCRPCPILALYLLAQRYVVRGIAFSGLKG